jgi:hypothetical protein
MHPFGLSRAANPAQAIAAHSRDLALSFITGGANLIGLIKDRAAVELRSRNDADTDSCSGRRFSTCAVYHATGKRIQDLPVTVEKLL